MAYIRVCLYRASSKFQTRNILFPVPLFISNDTVPYMSPSLPCSRTSACCCSYSATNSRMNSAGLIEVPLFPQQYHEVQKSLFTCILLRIWPNFYSQVAQPKFANFVFRIKSLLRDSLLSLNFSVVFLSYSKKI